MNIEISKHVTEIQTDKAINKNQWICKEKNVGKPGNRMKKNK